MRDQAKPRFSIVIPCYNEEAYIAETLQSLKQQDFKGAYEIIVVDNRCTDKTAAIAKRFGARIIQETAHAGVCWARQAGTKAARGEIVISSDADTIFAPHWLSDIDRAFRQDPSLVAVCGACVFRDAPFWGKAYPVILFGAVELGAKVLGHPFYVTATNIAFKKTVWRGYNTELQQGGDELDLLHNLRREGKVAFSRKHAVYTSSRRLSRGLWYNLFVTFLFYYLLAYHLNRLFKRQLIGAYPAYRDNAMRRLRLSPVLGALGAIMIVGLATHHGFGFASGVYSTAKHAILRLYQVIT